MTAADLECLSFDELEDELATLASHIFAGTCRWLDLVAELERRGGLSGCTTAEWLAWRCGLTPRTAREHVRVALRLVELPCIRAAFAVGELSYAKVRALTRIAEPESEEELLELARHLTAAQLDRTTNSGKTMPSPGGTMNTGTGQRSNRGNVNDPNNPMNR